MKWLLASAFVIVIGTTNPSFSAEYVHAILLIGQSNAVGQAAPLGSSVANFAFYNDKKIGSIRTTTTSASVGVGNSAGNMGPENALAQQLKAAYPNSDLAIIKFARGGSALEWGWDPDILDDQISPPPYVDLAAVGHVVEGEFYNDISNILAQGATALKTLDGFGQKTIGVPAVVWIQGEHDAIRKYADGTLNAPQSPCTESSTLLATPIDSSTGADNYQNNLHKFVIGTRSKVSSFNGSAYTTPLKFHYSTLSSTIDSSQTSENEFDFPNSDVLDVRAGQTAIANNSNFGLTNVVDLIDVDVLFSMLPASQIFKAEPQMFSRYTSGGSHVGCITVPQYLHYDSVSMIDLAVGFAQSIRLPGDVDGTQGYQNADALLLVDLDGDGDTDAMDLARLFGYAGTTKGDVGDLNLDGMVLFADFLILSNNFGNTGAVWAQGDLNSDGQVTFADFLILAANYDGEFGEIAAGP